MSDLADLPNIDESCFRVPSGDSLLDVTPSRDKPRILLLYGSLRERSFTLLRRGRSDYLVDRYSGPKESAEALSERVNQRAI